MAVANEHEDGVIPNLLYSGSDKSSFACDQCKKKKIKCDKVAPQCSHCRRLGRACEYPTSVPKPGPKVGSVRRRRSSSGGRHSPHGPGSKGHHGDDDDRNGSGDNSNYREAEYERAINMIHPQHHEQQPSETSWSSRERQGLKGTEGGHLAAALAGLGITEVQCQKNIATYFSSMCSFSLFHQPSFDRRLDSIRSPWEVQALLVTMAAFSQHFEPSGIRPKPPDRDLWSMAYRLARHCLEACGDEPPPLLILQIFLLVAWLKTIQGVRGLAFRLVGECIRMAYELNLNRELDKDPPSLTTSSSSTNSTSQSTPKTSWAEREERRRAWWMCWELDVFSSTIKRVPTGIDWSTNTTLLPIPDPAWFSGVGAASCPLALDPTERWKLVQKSGNTSWSAWFSLLNSYKYDIHLLSLPSLQSTRRRDFGDPHSSASGFSSAASGKPGSLASANSHIAASLEKRREVLMNCTHCATLALPEMLSVRDKFLSFEPSDRFNDHGRYSLHLMTQVIHFLLYRQDIIRSVLSSSASKGRRGSSTNAGPRSPSASPNTSRAAAADNAWRRFLSTASEAVYLFRNSAPTHVMYVNPCLSNAIWFAASAIVVGRSLAPSTVVADQELMTSNFDLLLSTLQQFVNKWNIPSGLVDRFDALEEQVAQLQISRDKSVHAAMDGKDLREKRETHGDGGENPPAAKRSRGHRTAPPAIGSKKAQTKRAGAAGAGDTMTAPSLATFTPVDTPSSATAMASPPNSITSYATNASTPTVSGDGRSPMSSLLNPIPTAFDTMKTTSATSGTGTGTVVGTGDREAGSGYSFPSSSSATAAAADTTNNNIPVATDMQALADNGFGMSAMQDIDWKGLLDPNAGGFGFDSVNFPDFDLFDCPFE